jgi:hypothetical protein
MYRLFQTPISLQTKICAICKKKSLLWKPCTYYLIECSALKSLFLSFHYIIPSTTLALCSNLTTYFNKNARPQIKLSVANSWHTWGIIWSCSVFMWFICVCKPLIGNVTCLLYYAAGSRVFNRFSACNWDILSNQSLAHKGVMRLSA